MKLTVVGNGAIGTLAAIYAKRLGGIDEVEIIGERHLATVQADAPLWDPQNTRIRAAL